MPLPAQEKQKVMGQFRRKEGDTGSPEVQIALITARITQLTEHLKKNKHDESSRRGLLAPGRQAPPPSGVSGQDRSGSVPRHHRKTQAAPDSIARPKKCLSFRRGIFHLIFGFLIGSRRHVGLVRLAVQHLNRQPDDLGA